MSTLSWDGAEGPLEVKSMPRLGIAGTAEPSRSCKAAAVQGEKEVRQRSTTVDLLYRDNVDLATVITKPYATIANSHVPRDRDHRASVVATFETNTITVGVGVQNL